LIGDNHLVRSGEEFLQAGLGFEAEHQLLAALVGALVNLWGSTLLSRTLL
jgi:hypothetical protein